MCVWVCVCGCEGGGLVRVGGGGSVCVCVRVGGCGCVGVGVGVGGWMRARVWVRGTVRGAAWRGVNLRRRGGVAWCEVAQARRCGAV